MVLRTRNPKGVTTRDAVSSESECSVLAFFPRWDTPSEDVVGPVVGAVNEWATWLLLTYRDTSAREVRCELSRPVNIGIDGRVDGWAERIILGSIPFDSDEFTLTHGNNEGGEWKWISRNRK